MGSKEAIEALQAGADAWRTYLSEQPAPPIPAPSAAFGIDLSFGDFENLDLTGVDLSGAKLECANFSGAILQDANLNHADLPAAKFDRAKCQRADFSGAKFTRFGLSCDGADFTEACFDHAEIRGPIWGKASFRRASFRFANLRGVSWSEADLTDTTFENARLSNSSFRRGRLKGANFQNSVLSEAGLNRADLEGANFNGAKLPDADMRSAHLTGASFENADLTRANLMGCKDLRLDSTIVRHTRWSHNAKDRWNVLRRTYTGSRFAYIMLLTVISLAPYYGKAALWSTVAKVETTALLHSDQARSRWSEFLSDQATSLEGEGGEVNLAIAQVFRELSVSLQEWTSEWTEKWTRTQVWKLLIGAERGWSFLVLFPVCVLSYNFIRGGLTLWLLPMREDLDSSGHTPPYKLYGKLIWVHWFNLGLALVVIALFLYNSWFWLSQPVYIP